MQTKPRRAGLPSLNSSQCMVDDDVDDAGNLPRHALAFRLQPMFKASVIVGDAFKRADQDDVEIWRFAGDAAPAASRGRESIGAAQIRLAVRSEKHSGCADAQR